MAGQKHRLEGPGRLSPASGVNRRISRTWWQVTNYISTFSVLSADYIRTLGGRTLLLSISLLVAGFTFSFAFVALAAVGHALVTGSETVPLSIIWLNEEVETHTAFLGVLALLVCAFSLRFIAGRYATSCGLAWQTSIFWRTLNEVPRLANWNVIRPIPLPLSSRTLVPLLLSMSRSSFLVHRALTLGLEHVAVIVASILVLAWLDFSSVVMLALIAALFAPLYSRSFRKLTRLRAQAQRERRKRQRTLELIIQERLKDCTVNQTKLGLKDLKMMQPVYGLANLQLYAMNDIYFLVGLQIIISIVVIYLTHASALTEFSWSNLVFLVALLVLLRSFLSLMALISRLSRGYSGLVILRHYTYPRTKPSISASRHPVGAFFVISDQKGNRLSISPGRPVFVLAPEAEHAFELLALTNALQTLRPPPGIAHLLWLNSESLDRWLDDKERNACADDETAAKHGSCVGVPNGSRMNFDVISVVALSLEAWHLLIDRAQADRFCANRVVFVIVTTKKALHDVPEDAHLIVLDGALISDVGAYSTVDPRLLENAFLSATERGAESTLDIEDGELGAI